MKQRLFAFVCIFLITTSCYYIHSMDQVHVYFTEKEKDAVNPIKVHLLDEDLLKKHKRLEDRFSDLDLDHFRLKRENEKLKKKFETDKKLLSKKKREYKAYCREIKKQLDIGEKEKKEITRSSRIFWDKTLDTFRIILGIHGVYYVVASYIKSLE